MFFILEIIHPWVLTCTAQGRQSQLQHPGRRAEVCPGGMLSPHFLFNEQDTPFILAPPDGVTAECINSQMLLYINGRKPVLPKTKSEK